MKIMVVEPYQKPQFRSIEGTLEEMQQIVGGDIEVIYPFDDNIAVVCNDEGKLEGLPTNRLLVKDGIGAYDALAGTIFVCGIGKEKFTSIPAELEAKYYEKFRKICVVTDA